LYTTFKAVRAGSSELEIIEDADLSLDLLDETEKINAVL